MTRLFLYAALASLLLGATKGWPTKKLSELGKLKFAFDGKVKIPPEAKTSTTAMTANDKRVGTMAYVELSDGVKVMLAERAKGATKETAPLEEMLGITGKVTTRKDPKGYWIIVERDDGLAVQGANWAVEPGIDCATEKPVTKEQAAVVDEICRSFSK